MLTKQGKLGLIVCAPLMIGLVSILSSQNGSNQNQQGSFSIPNPFQKNISKSVYVLEYVTNTYVPGSGINYLERGCLDQTTNSIRKKEFDELLSKGVKVTNSIPKKTEVTVGGLHGECVGASYILEGPENLLNNL